MGSHFEEELFQRLDRYVRIDTQSDASSPTSPSTEKQYDLLQPAGGGAGGDRRAGRAPDRLRRGAGDDPGDRRRPRRRRSPSWRTSTRRRSSPAPASSRSSTATSTAATSSCRTTRRWCSRPAELPYLATKVGDDIVTASGTTLLGADDKAGVAIIMAMARHLMQPTPTSRTGRCGSASRRTRRSAAASTPTCPRTWTPPSPTRWTARELGEIVYETFSADAAVVTVQGVSIHPG